MDNDKTEIYNNEIVPLLDKIKEICIKEQVPFLIACQLAVDEATGAVKVAIQSLFNEETTLQLTLAAQLLRGEADTETTNTISVALQDHLQSCAKCAEKIAAIRSANPNVNDADLINIMASYHMDSNEQLDNSIMFTGKKPDLIH